MLELHEVVRRYAAGDGAVAAVQGVTLTLEAGEFVAIMGPSGCGKSTLLHICGAMDRPSGGQVRFEGAALEALSDSDLTRLRRERIGFVFQFFNLLPTLSVVENIALPLLLAGASYRDASARARDLAARVGLAARAERHPRQLSGGEMQRCAIARAIVHDPVLLVADEPTGNLDSTNGERILALLAELQASLGMTLLLATHAAEVAAAATRVVHMRDGRIDRIVTNANGVPLTSTTRS